MPNSKIILTKTNRPNATPHPNDLDYGELAINYEDGLLFFKNNSNRISKIASSGSFSQLTRHLADRENPHEVTKAQVGLDRVDNTRDSDKLPSNPTQAALDEKVNLTTLNSQYYNSTQTDGRISTKFGEIDILINSPSSASPAGNLSYNIGSNTFTFTQATIPTLSSLGGLGIDSVVINQKAPAVGTGVLTYQGAGVFIYDTPTIGGLGGYAKTEIGLNAKTADRSFDGTLTYNDGKFTYDKPTIVGLTDGKIRIINNVLEVEGFATQVALDELAKTQSDDNNDRVAETSGLDDHASAKNNPHQVTKAQVGLGSVQDKSSATIRSEIVDGDIPDSITRDSELSAHTSLTNNPHNVTKVQVGLGNVENKSSADIRGEIVDGDIPNSIARSAEVNTRVKNLGNVTGIQKLTQDAYDLLTPDASTVYIIVDEL